MSSPAHPEPPPILIGTCFMGPCDGQTFQHTADMRRVKIRDREKPPQQHIYAWHEELSRQHGKPMFLCEEIEAWKVG